jgi:ABC-type branched-subunit amino acid transport system substrate-binding protein
MMPARVGAVAALLLLSTACGSTVPGSATLSAGAPQAVVDDGLGAAPPVVEAETAATGPAGTGSAALPAQPVQAGAPAGAVSSPTTGSSTAAPGTTATTVATGVTSTTITIGVIAADPSADQTLESAGFGAAAVGNEPANWQAAADEVNARGGVGGRQVKLLFHLVNLTDPPSVQGQAACARFTEDNTVAVVLSGYYYGPAHTCLSQQGVPALLGTNYGVDRTAAQQTQTVVSWATPLLDRLAATLADGYSKLGRLKPGTTVGLFVVDSPAYRRSAGQLQSALTGRGLKVVTQTVRDSETGDYSGASGDASAAVLQFRSAGVTEVLFLSRNAFEPTLLMQAASSQGYEPTYLLSTQQYPAGLVGLVPPSQLDGALALGWAPAVDLTSGYADRPEAQRCLKALEKRGRSFSSGTQALVALLACDGLDLLDRAADRPGALSSRQALLGATVAAGNGFPSAVTYPTAFPGGRRDGVAAYRPMAFSSDCRCFSYTGPTRPM